MGNTPVAFIDETGIHVPDFPTIFTFFQDAYRGIYGADTYLEPDSQDGQFLGILATAILDTNAMAVQCYNSFSPSTAVGTGLSSVVKINGIARKLPSKSSVDVLIVGQAATVITNGVVADVNNIEWVLPNTIVIPYSGQITVTAVCSVLGAITALANTVTTIVNTQPGWQTVTNLAEAAVGDPVETDVQLRLRQALSTEIPSLGLLEGLVGALWELPGVRAITAYENATNIPDDNGIPGHCIALVIDGGDLAAIAPIIQAKKGGGVGTYGNNVSAVTDRFGVPHEIAFFRPDDVPIAWVVEITGLDNFSMNTQAAIAQALSDWTNNLGIGTQLRIKRAYVPANLFGAKESETYELTGLKASRDGAAVAESDIVIAFNERPFCLPSYVQFHFPPGP